MVGADECVFLVRGDGDDGQRPGHLQHVVGIVGRRHELGQRWAAKDPIVWQGDLSDIEVDLLCPIVQLASKCNGQRDFTFRLAPSRVDPFKRARLFEVSRESAAS